MGKSKQFPAINAVASVLREKAAHIEWGHSKDEDAFCDVRLQIMHDPANPRVMTWWQIHIGPSDYDVDHRGSWGASSIPKGSFNSRALAADLIEQAKDQVAQRAEFHKAMQGIRKEGV